MKIRASELDVSLVRQGVADKIEVLHEIVEKLGLELRHVGYIGDDLPDLPVLHAVGLGVAVADAAAEVRQVADFITSLPGGHGAVRETVEMILQNQQRWEDLIRSFGDWESGSSRTYA